MRSLRLSHGRIARVTLELALGAFTLWLVAQNALLLAYSPWKDAPVPLVVLGAVLKVTFVLLTKLWPFMLGAAIAAGLLAIALTRGPAGSEVRHV
jgi:hypothetical protein